MKNDKKTETKRADIHESRRRFLKSAGKLAIYTPPAMMVLAKPSQASLLISPLVNNDVT